MSLQKQLKVYFVMGSNNCNNEPIRVVEEALKGGITMFQFREKGANRLTGEAKVQFAREIHVRCKQYNIPFIVNDDVELALQVDADGVHIGQEDEPIGQVRKQIGNKILGVSAHNVYEAKIAIEQGADYLGVGPMFHTKTKQVIREVQGPKVIAEMREKGILVPIVGIGGIESSNAAQVVKAGADGVAVISSISKAESSRKATEQLVGIVEQCNTIV